MRGSSFIIVLVLSLATDVAAQGVVELRSVEVGTEYESVSGDFTDTRGVRGQAVLGAGGGVWHVEWSAQERFGEAGVVFGVGHSRLLGRRWVGSAHVGSSTAGAYHARLRAGAGVGRKWGTREQIVTTLGVRVHDARDVHRDLVVIAEGAYYAGATVLQIGNRYTISTPGDARGHYLHAALTHSQPEGRSVSGRFGLGREAYLLVEPLTAEVEFRSWEMSLAWTEPVYGPWSVTLRASLYHNPYYERGGVAFGVLRQF